MLDSILGFLDKNGGLIDKGLGLVKNVYSAFDQNNNQQAVRDGYLQILERKGEIEKANQQRELDFLNAMAASSGGSGSSGPSISPAAMAAQQKAQMRAQKKGYKASKKMLEGVAASYQPFIDAGRAVMPKQVENFNQYLDDSKMLSHYLSGAAMKAFQEGSTPVSQIKVDPSAYKVNVPQAAPVDFSAIFKKGY